MRKRPPPHNLKRARSFGTNYRYEFIAKDGSVVQSKSFMARIPALLFERDKDIVCYKSFSIEIFYKTVDGKEKSHMPDYEVLRKDGTIEIHVLPSAKEEKRKLLDAAKQPYCPTVKPKVGNISSIQKKHCLALRKP